MGKITLSLEEEKPTPETLVMDRILNNYGLFCSPGEITKDNKKKIIKIPILANMPLRIPKEVTEKEIITSVDVGKVGEITFTPNEPYKLLYAPTINSIIKQMRVNYEDMRNVLGKDLIKSSKLFFGKIESIKRPLFKPVINTLALIIRNLQRNQESIGYDDLLEFEGDRYIELLINSRLVEKIETKYGYRIFPLDKFKMLLKESKNNVWSERKPEDLFIGYIIQENYESLITKYNQNLLKSMVRTCIGLYEPSVFVGHPLKLTEDRWIKNIYRGYNFSKKHEWNIKLSHIPDLVDAEIVLKENGGSNVLYTPNEDIFNSFLIESEEHRKMMNIQPLESYV